MNSFLLKDFYIPLKCAPWYY